MTLHRKGRLLFAIIYIFRIPAKHLSTEMIFRLPLKPEKHAIKITITSIQSNIATHGSILFIFYFYGLFIGKFVAIFTRFFNRTHSTEQKNQNENQANERESQSAFRFGARVSHVLSQAHFLISRSPIRGGGGCPLLAVAISLAHMRAFKLESWNADASTFHW